SGGPIRLVRQGECRPRNAGNGPKKGAIKPVGSHRLAVETPEVAEGIVREVYVPRRCRAVEGTQAAAGRHQVPAANHIVLEDQPTRPPDEIPAPPSVGKRIPRHQPTAHPTEKQRARATAVEIAVGYFDIGSPEPHGVRACAAPTRRLKALRDILL